MLRRIFVSIGLGLLVVGVTAAVGFAASTPNFHQGPTCTVGSNGATSAVTSCSGTLYGVGNETLQAKVTTLGFATYTCQNGGGNTAPGQNQVTAGPNTSAPSDISGADKNGATAFSTFDSTLTAADTVGGKVAGCPNKNWTGVNPQLTVTSVTLLITQGNRKIYECTVANPAGETGTLTFPTSC